LGRVLWDERSVPAQRDPRPWSSPPSGRGKALAEPSIRRGAELAAVTASATQIKRSGVPYRRSVDLEEFIRRVKVYLDLDFPGLADAEGVAAALGVRLFQYVRQPLPEAYRDSRTVRSLLRDEPALLFFTADWDGSAPGYRAVVGRVGEALGLRVVDVDIDDPVGSALARLQRVLNTPCVIGTWNPDLRVVGERAEEELTELFGRRHRP
jgi:hypothetical protein